MIFGSISEETNLIIILIASIFVIGIGFGITIPFWNRAVRRKNKWKQFALSHRLQFAAADTQNIPKLYSDFLLFKQGINKIAYNICQGEEKGFTITAFNYQYIVPSGIERIISHHFSVLIFQSQLFFRPILILNNKLLHELDIFDTFGSKITRNEINYLSGTNEIYFESEAFNRKYYITCDNKKYAYDIINPRMIPFLQKNPEINIEARDNSVVFFQNRIVTISAMDSYLIFAHDFFEMIPLHIKKESVNPGKKGMPFLQI